MAKIMFGLELRQTTLKRTGQKSENCIQMYFLSCNYFIDFPEDKICGIAVDIGLGFASHLTIFFRIGNNGFKKFLEFGSGNIAVVDNFCGAARLCKLSVIVLMQFCGERIGDQNAESAEAE